MFGCFLKWDPENLTIMFYNFDRHNDDLKEFCENRLAKIKSFKISYVQLNFPMVDYILSRAGELETFELELSSPFDLRSRLPSIKKLLLVWKEFNMDPSVEDITKVHRVFPNLRSLEMRYPCFEPSEDIVNLVKVLYPDLDEMILQRYSYQYS
jgi:hypothetical protein